MEEEEKRLMSRGISRDIIDKILSKHKKQTIIMERLDQLIEGVSKYREDF